MTSSFTWLDYSEHERRKMLDVVKQFSERDTRDELGLGSIRDAIADLFFPGTSTIQTRARYFFFVPWMYLDLEKRTRDSGRISEKARGQETVLIKTLLEAGEIQGVIGRLAQDKLQRLPSNIYWQGLGVLGIRLFHGSQDQYHRYLSTSQPTWSRRPQPDEESDIRITSNWHPGLPLASGGFPRKADLSLTYAEADFLRERLQTRARESLFTFWASRRTRPPQCAFPWEVVDANHPEHLCEQLEHAQNFSETVHGAALLYNLLLAEQANRSEWTGIYQELLAQWTQLISARMSSLLRWDRNRFWEIAYRVNPRIPLRTRAFVDQWLHLVFQSNQPASIVNDPSARELIRSRERFLKGGQARLENRRALDLWNGAAGMRQLDFRWSVAQRHLQDIHDGLRTQ